MTHWIRKLAGMGWALAFGAVALAQSYPNRPVKIIVPFATGGPADNYARFAAQKLHKPHVSDVQFTSRYRVPFVKPAMRSCVTAPGGPMHE